MSQENVEIVRACVAAFNRGDLDEALKDMDPYVVFRPVADWPEGDAHKPPQSRPPPSSPNRGVAGKLCDYSSNPSQFWSMPSPGASAAPGWIEASLSLQSSGAG